MQQQKFLAVFLSAALLVAAPGPLATDIFAAVIVKAVSHANIGTNVGTLGATTLGSLSVPGTQNSLVMPTLGSSRLPALTISPLDSTIQPALQQAAPQKTQTAKITAEKIIRFTPTRTRPVRAALNDGVKQITEARSPAARGLALKSFFTGSRSRSSPEEAADSATVAGAFSTRLSELRQRSQILPDLNAADVVASPQIAAEKMSSEKLAAGERMNGPEAAHFSLDAHTIRDLELFSAGHGLFSLTDKTQSTVGSDRLRWLLTHPYLDHAEIRKRQEAVSILLENDSLRAEVRSAFANLKGNGDSVFKSYIVDGKLETMPRWKFLNIMGLLPLSAAYFAPKFLLVMIYLAPMFMERSISDLRWVFQRFKAVFRLARVLSPALSKSDSEALKEIGIAFSAVEDAQHPDAVTSIAGSFRRLKGQWTLILDLFYMHSGKTLWFLQRRFTRDKERIALLAGAMAELDVYLTLADNAASWQKGYSMPTLLDQKQARLKIEQGHQPYLNSTGDSVANNTDMIVNLEMDRSSGGNFMILTGVNAGGKSTYLSMISLLTLLAQIGSPVPAASMEFTPLRLMTTIEISQSLQRGESFYVAEAKRMLEIIKEAEANSDVLAIFDEILLGTNPEERTAAEHSLIPFLAKTGNLFVLSTHDLKMTALEETVPGVRNVHIDETQPYTISPGPATTRNAIDTLEGLGYPPKIIRAARAYLKKHPQ
ncbi:MAG: hypothetical protein COB53_06880 [Elusimicrobia bacterium]|nr:MAG: hypothetical protein COB53_06880 [Elusimicrobiota bacterium]